MSDRSKPEPRPLISSGIGSGTKSDIGELTALFSAQSGGKLPKEVSADLALEIVLNEIVEQACLATGANGAAVLLERDGEMMCRASSGTNAPELGARVGGAGLTAQCIKTLQVQRCDDAQSDPRADVEASRRLGVRSVMVLPLLRNGGLAGVLEVFSSRPSAFGERDEVTLQTLAQQILKNMERASRPFMAKNLRSSEGPARSFAENEVEEFAADINPPIIEKIEKEAISQIEGWSPRLKVRRLTLALSAAVLACSVLLAIVVGYRLGWRKTATEEIAAEKSVVAIEQARAAEIRAKAVTVPPAGPASSVASNSEVAQRDKKDGSAGESTPRPNESAPSEGGLVVYENGKEIFRMTPTGQTSGYPAQRSLLQSSVVVPAGIVELSPEAAAGSLLHRVEPEYPEAARQQGIQGTVVLDVRIGRDGGIQDMKAVSGQSVLTDAAMNAVKQWRFRPRMQSGQPVEMQTRVTLNFRLPG